MTTKDEDLIRKVQDWRDSLNKQIAENGGELPMSDEDMEIAFSMSDNAAMRLLKIVMGSEFNDLMMFYIGMSWQQFKTEQGEKDANLDSLLGNVDIPDKL